METKREYAVDVGGHTVSSVRHDQSAVTTTKRMEHEIDRISLIVPDTVFTTWNPNPPERGNVTPDTVSQGYDAAGNRTSVLEVTHRWVDDHYVRDYTQSISGYSADNRMRYFERKGRDHTPASRSVIEHYRYDALGRRVLLRSERDTLCTRDAPVGRCDESIQRFIWDGAQLLRETYTAAGRGASQAFLESTPSSGLSYTHGPGIDRPLAVTSGTIASGTLVPHLNWRGLYDAGTTATGTHSSGLWPGRQTDMQMNPDISVTDPGPFLGGSLLTGMHDNSGLMYRRNRYYDPKTGQFTQEDPIGLAGGLNLYGYANGDPVNFSDPFGLCPMCVVPLVAGGTSTTAGGAALAGAAAAAAVAVAANAEKISDAVEGAVDAVRDKLETKFVTYTRTHPVTGQVYSGRTSGMGDPQALVNARAQTHPARLAGFGPAVVDRWATGAEGYAAIRGREQHLIDINGRAQSDGGTSANTIRGISKVNPLLPYYNLAAFMMFGGVP